MSENGRIDSTQTVLTWISWVEAQHVIKSREVLGQLGLGSGAAMLGAQLALVVCGCIVLDALLDHLLGLFFDPLELVVLRTVGRRVERAVADAAVVGEKWWRLMAIRRGIGGIGGIISPITARDVVSQGLRHRSRTQRDVHQRRP